MPTSATLPLLSKEKEDTLVLYGEENAVKVIQQFYSKVATTSILCADANIAPAILQVKEYRDVLQDLIKRGVKRLLLTEITKENLAYCKELAKVVEIRHIDGMKGNFAVSDTEYMASAVMHQTKPVTQIIYSNVQAIVQQHQYLFESLWNKAIPAEQRIRELEEGIESISLEILSSNQESGARGLKMVENAKEQVLLLFPTVSVFNAALKLGIGDICNSVAKRGVTVKILARIDDKDVPLTAAQTKLLLPLPSIQIRTFHQEEKEESEGIMMAILVVDNREVIAWNLLDVDASDLYQMAGNAIYSSNCSVVSSYRFIFDSLWRQVELYEQIKTHDQIQKEFINIAAHELRTPIQPILGMADLIGYLEEDGKGEVRLTKDDMALIIRNAKRLERLSLDILEIAKIESGNFQLNVQEFNLNDIISPLVQDARNEIGNAVKVQYVSSPSGIITLKGDRNKLAEVVWNLLDNAIKFTETGMISIEAKRDDDSNNITVAVRDTGRGIDPQILPKLFTKFATRSEKGTGLGLYISKSIIDAHGGKIWAENNKDGKGATFTFALPLSAGPKAR